MSHLLDENDEMLAPSAREMTLGTGSILAIFFGLTLLCGLFFGFGYNVGHRSASAALLSATAEPRSPEASPNSPSSSFEGFKPSSGSGTKSSGATPVAVDEPGPSMTTPATTVAAPRPSPGANNPKAATTSKPAVVAAHPGPTATSASRPSEITPPPSATAGAPAGTFFVQIAAVSHTEDAAMILTALRARGYAVAQRTEPTDKLFHIQVGPLASKTAADSMRLRLQADGYNAIIK